MKFATQTQTYQRQKKGIADVSRLPEFASLDGTSFLAFLREKGKKKWNKKFQMYLFSESF